MNVKVNSFRYTSYYGTCSDEAPRSAMLASGKTTNYWVFSVDKHVAFVVNDTEKGVVTRAKNHFRKMKSGDKFYNTGTALDVFVFSPLDKSKPMRLDLVFKKLHEVPAAQRANASELIEKERAVSGNNRAAGVSIIALKTEMYYGREKKVWEDIGKLSSLDATETYYYVPLSGYTPVSGIDAKYLVTILERSGIPKLQAITVYGVRKSDIDLIKTQANWVDLEEYLKKNLKKLCKDSITNIAISNMDIPKFFRYNKAIVDGVTDTNSPYSLFAKKIGDVSYGGYYTVAALEWLIQSYSSTVDITNEVNALQEECHKVQERYPLICSLTSSYATTEAVVEYINLIDAKKGI